MRLTAVLQSARSILPFPNRWDIVVLPAILGLLFWLGW